MKFTAKPQLTVALVGTDNEGKQTTIDIKEGVILKDLTFAEGKKNVTKTGKVTEVMVTTKASKPDYNACACNLESAFADAITVDGFVLDASSVYGADVSMVYVKDIKEIGEVVASEVVIDPATAVEGAIAQAIAELQPGQEIVLAPGKITEDIVVPAGVTIKGANAGISAASGYRCQAEVEGETVLDGNLVVAGQDVVLEGITLTDKAIVRVGAPVATAAADAEGNEYEVTLKNCRILGLSDDTSINQQAVIGVYNYNDKVLLNVEGCYFGDNCADTYNLINMHTTLKTGSVVKNNYFTKDSCTNNIVNIYQVDEGEVVIDIDNNVMEHSHNLFRITVTGAPHLTVNATGNRYLATNEPYIEEKLNMPCNWGGIMFIQPTEKTVDMSNITINLNKTVNESDNPQLWYYYEGSKQVPFAVENRPKVYVDGVLDTYEGKEYLTHQYVAVNAEA